MQCVCGGFVFVCLMANSVFFPPQKACEESQSVIDAELNRTRGSRRSRRRVCRIEMCFSGLQNADITARGTQLLSQTTLDVMGKGADEGDPLSVTLHYPWLHRGVMHNATVVGRCRTLLEDAHAVQHVPPPPAAAHQHTSAFFTGHFISLDLVTWWWSPFCHFKL